MHQLAPTNTDTDKQEKSTDTPLTSEGDDTSKHDRSTDTPLTSEGEEAK